MKKIKRMTNVLIYYILIDNKINKKIIDVLKYLILTELHMFVILAFLILIFIFISKHFLLNI
jgi:hypothetical protein